MSPRYRLFLRFALPALAAAHLGSLGHFGGVDPWWTAAFALCAALHVVLPVHGWTTSNARLRRALNAAERAGNQWCERGGRVVDYLRATPAHERAAVVEMILFPGRFPRTLREEVTDE